MEIKNHVLTTEQPELRSDKRRQKTARDNIDAAKKVSGAVSGHLATLDKNGDLTDSGIAKSTVVQGVKVKFGDKPASELPIDSHGKVQVELPGEFSGIGTTGFVPTPKAGDENKVLASDGSWAEIVIPEQEQADWKQTDKNAYSYIKNKPGEFKGIGTSGFVPTPKAGDENKVLASDGSWAEIVIPAQEQSDWNETDTTSSSYIRNKPDIGAMIGEETARAEAAETELRNDLGAETTRAEFAETELHNEIVGETARAEAVEAALSDELSAETERAEAAEAAATTEVRAGENATVDETVGADGHKIYTVNADGKPQVQADWEQSDTTAVDYIKNKPGVFTGATEQSAGTAGFVPAPLVADREKFLCGDGTWSDVDNTRACTASEMDAWLDEVDNG